MLQLIRTKEPHCEVQIKAKEIKESNAHMAVWDVAKIDVGQSGYHDTDRDAPRNSDKISCVYTCIHMSCITQVTPGAVARSEASSLGMQAAPSSIPTSGTFFRGDLVMKTFLRPFSFFRWFKKSSCQLLAKECALSTGKLPRRLAQEQCG